MGLLPEHLSCYGLKLEEGTPLYERRGELTLPDEEQQADMYLYAVEFLKQGGYELSEISNFARPGFASRHNLRYRFRQRFEPLAALLRQCAGQGLAEEDEHGWHLTPKGFLVSNRIIGMLQDELAREKNRRLQAAARGDYRMV